jgi:hypothetical protein
MQVLERATTRNGSVPHEPETVPLAAPATASPVANPAPVPTGGLRLNIGAGKIDVPGFISIDRKTGGEAYPLQYPDGSVDEIVASHVLEHFSHLEVWKVLQDWTNKLKPGGRIRLAVPDFEVVCNQYLAGVPIHIQGYVMGGHLNADDHHGAIFDRESLEELMTKCGLERIGRWASPLEGCSSATNSLNLQGFKPSGPTVDELPNVRAIMSVPRFGPLMHPRCAEKVFFNLRIKAQSGQSCFWHQKLSDLMEGAIVDPSCDFVLTMDFDTVFSTDDVLELYRLMQAKPDADAIFPLQSKRGCETALFSVTDGSGNLKRTINSADLERQLLPANTGHFGLTLIRAESLRKFPRPWMVPEPSPEGLWDGSHRDVDIDFWRRFKAAGFNAFLAPQIVVGHLEEVVKWPGKDLRPIYQATEDYEKAGIPPEVER